MLEKKEYIRCFSLLMIDSKSKFWINNSFYTGNRFIPEKIMTLIISLNQLHDWKLTKINCTSYGVDTCWKHIYWWSYLLFKMTEKEKKELENFVRKNGYNEELQDTYIRDVLDKDKIFDDDFDIDWEV